MKEEKSKEEKMNITRESRDEIENKGGEKMEEIREKDFLKLLSAKGTREILEFMNQHGTVQYKQMMQFVNTPTLNQRLRELLIFGLISHHLERVETRREWYEITEKGKHVLKHVRALIMIAKKVQE